MDDEQPTSEVVLWQRLQAGDTDVFGELFKRHAAAVYNHCFRRTASWSAAEELTSIVFLETWRRRRSVRLSEDGSLLPFLLGVANNVTRNSQRSYRRHRRMLARLPSPQTIPDPADGAAARLDSERQMTRVLAAIARMSPEDQEVLALCAWAGLTYSQAGVALELPPTTVRSRLARARERLRGVTQTPALPTEEKSAVPSQPAPRRSPS